MQSRRNFLLTGTAAAVARSGRAQSRPNVLWISCEDTSPDLGCYGDAYASTPNLDRLAAQGARFSNAFSTYGVCAPSRSSIITGMYPATIGTQHMRSQGVPPPYVKCFPEYLRAAGYYCTNNVKTDYNFAAPATAWDESSNRAHWRNRASGQPFFSVFNLTVSHESQIRAPRDQFERQTAVLAPGQRHDPEKAQVPPYYPHTPVVRRDWANYYDLVSAVDYQAGRYLKELEDAGLADHTIVFFWGDHGRGLPRAKRWVYDSGIHVPLIVRWPGGLQPGSVRDQLVSLMDLGPTVLNLAGVHVPKYMQGQPFLGPNLPPARRYVFAARDRMDETYDIIRAVRDKQYKYIRNYQPCKPYAQYIDYMDQMPTLREWRHLHAQGKLKGPQQNFFAPEKPVEELYDATRDPHEVNNLAGNPEYSGTLKRLRAAHEKFMKDTGDLALLPEDQLKERMRPGGRWSEAATPSITPAGGRFPKAVQVTLGCPTEGASIAWTTGSGDKPHWNLYSQPVRLDRSTAVRVKACRLGWKDSPETTARFEIG
ncbi:MAG: sulfatase-like hydrolase/transferase [Acidobacteria bacterium]|nr:sulfatase-like hydrolase/transferase [Acidobacteriota bacterium]MBI3278882.1 sulfatase-like hydrolase/transferase [Acidobacteriota bacterium]